MSDTNKQITKCLTFIKDSLTDVGSVADKLIEKDVLKMSERESIVSNKYTKEQIQSLLDIVTKRKKGDIFIAVLYETHNEHVAKKITAMEITTGHTDFDRSKTFTKNHAETKESEPKVLKELANAQLEIERFKNLHGKLREELNKKTMRLKTINLKCIQLENENTKLKTENAEKTENRQEITQLKTEIERLEMELDDKNKEINILDKELIDAADELRCNKETHKEVVDKLLTDNAQLKTDIKQLQLENADIKSKYEDMLRKHSQMEADILQLKASVSKLEENGKQLTPTVSRLKPKRKPKQHPRPIPPWGPSTKTKIAAPHYK